MYNNIISITGGTTMKLSEKIIELRKSKGMTQEELASKVLIADEARGGNWFVDFKAGNVKYVVFRNKVLQYHIGNAKEKSAVLFRGSKRASGRIVL